MVCGLLADEAHRFGGNPRQYTNSQFLLCFNFRQRGKTRSHYHAWGCVYYAAARSDLQYVALRGPEDEPEQLNGAKPENLDLLAGTHNLPSADRKATV